ncbi:MAG: hypothetical protein RBU37_22655 [Myxococcota bacterium]|nr:hypothetical protein [Myxococcota bacterium]
MARANDILDELGTLFRDPSVDDLVVMPSGEVYFGSELGRRPASTSLTPRMQAMLAESLLELARIREAGCFEVLHEKVLWSLSLPPLSSGYIIHARRIDRARRMLGEFVEDGILSSDFAQSLVGALRSSRNILLVSPDQQHISTLLDAMLSLLAPGLLSFVIGDLRETERDLDIAFVERSSLELLDAAGVVSFRKMLRRARWVFMERIANPVDLDWWFGGDFFARGRIGGMTAANAEQAIERLGAMHRALFGYQGSAPSLLDAVVFIEQLRPGRSNAVHLNMLTSDTADSSSEPIRSPSAELRSASFEVRGAPAPSPRPTSRELRAAEIRTPAPGVPAVEPPRQRSSGIFDGVMRRAESSDRLPATEAPLRSASGHYESSRPREPEPPRGRGIEPEAAPRSRPIEPVREDEAPTGATITTDPSILADISALRRRNISAISAQQEAESPRRRPLSSSGLLRPRSSHEAMANLEEVEADFSLDDAPPTTSLSDAVSSAFSDFGAELMSNEAPASAPAANPSDMMFSPGELDDFLNDGEDAPAAPEQRQRGVSRSAGPSRYSVETARHDADSIRAQRGRYQPDASPPPSPPPSETEVRASGRWRPVAGRGAATPAIARSGELRRSSPEMPAVSEPQPDFMQEGTLDDVEAPFADEPTRRADWSDAKPRKKP